MKNENISKINRLGKLGKTFMVFFIIASIAVCAASTLISIALFTLDDDFISGEFHGTGKLSTNISSSLIGDIDESEISFDRELNLFGITFKLDDIADIKIDSDSKNPEDNSADLILDIEVPSGKKIRIAGGLFTAAVAVAAVVFTISLKFARNFFASLEKCSSPFEENVLNQMKKFSLSLIPWVLFNFIIYGPLNLTLLIIILIVFLITSIFKYGAELQKESDETL